MTQTTVELPEVVKDYIKSLPREKQDRLLTGKLVAVGCSGSWEAPFAGEGCLIQVAEASRRAPFEEDRKKIYQAFDAFVIDTETQLRGAGFPIPRTANIVRDYILELRAEEIVGPGSATVPVERRWVPQLVAIGLSLVMVLV